MDNIETIDTNEKVVILNKSNSTDQHFLGYFLLFVLL